MAVRGSAASLWDQKWGQPGALRLDVQQPLFRQSVIVPAVSFVASPGPPRIEWVAGDERSSPDLESCLNSFTRLADSPSDSRLVAFAKRWGPLGICEHGRPGMHSGGGCAPLDAGDRYWDQERIAWDTNWWTGHGNSPPLHEWRGKYWEPLVAYRFYVRQVAAAIRLLAALQSGLPTRTDDWSWVVSGLDSDVRLTDNELATREWMPPQEARTDADRYQRDSLEMQREFLCRIVNQWLSDAGVHPSLSWGSSGASLDLALGKPLVPPEYVGPVEMTKYVWHGAALYGILMAQLAAVVSANGGLTNCSMCSQSYLPRRKVRSDRRHYCSDECRHIAHLADDAEYQRRKRLAASAS